MVRGDKDEVYTVKSYIQKTVPTMYFWTLIIALVIELTLPNISTIVFAAEEDSVSGNEIKQTILYRRNYTFSCRSCSPNLQL